MKGRRKEKEGESKKKRKRGWKEEEKKKSVKVKRKEKEGERRKKGVGLMNRGDGKDGFFDYNNHISHKTLYREWIGHPRHLSLLLIPFYRHSEIKYACFV